MSEATKDENQLVDILDHLHTHRNVLLSGPPGTGKSRMLSAVKNSFQIPDLSPTAGLFPADAISIPEIPPAGATLHPVLDGLSAVKTFEMTFDQNTKFSDLLRGVVPRIGEQMGFRVSEGLLYRAAEFARVPGQASLLIIDEINRGPAISIFGSAMVALEPNKRLDGNGGQKPESQSFQLLNDSGAFEAYYLPDRLYIVAAMNQADTSVEPMDVAFIRRFARVTLVPDEEPVLDHFELSIKSPPAANVPTQAHDAYIALFFAWKGINGRIARGKGVPFQMGHGLLMREAASTDLAIALEQISDTWDLMYEHLAEIFYGDVRGLAEALGAESTDPAYAVEEAVFGDQQVAVLQVVVARSSVYQRLLAAR